MQFSSRRWWPSGFRGPVRVSSPLSFDASVAVGLVQLGSFREGDSWAPFESSVQASGPDAGAGSCLWIISISALFTLLEGPLWRPLLCQALSKVRTLDELTGGTDRGVGACTEGSLKRTRFGSHRCEHLPKYVLPTLRFEAESEGFALADEVGGAADPREQQVHAADAGRRARSAGDEPAARGTSGLGA